MEKATIRQLREEYDALVGEARNVSETARQAKREMTDEETERFDELEAEARGVLQAIRSEERIGELEASGAQHDAAVRRERERKRTTPGPEQLRQDYARAFAGWLRYGHEGIGADCRQVLRSVNAQNMGDPLLQQITRAQSTTDGAGGYTIPEDWIGEVEAKKAYYGGMFEAARVVPTATGANLPWPAYDDTSNVGYILGENLQIAAQDITFTEVTLGSFLYSSKAILVSFQLLQDTGVPLETLVRDVMAERLGRIQNTHLTTGDGSSKPNGVVTDATDATVTTGTALVWNAPQGTGNALKIWTDLVDLEHTVDRAYRRNARWMLSDACLKVLKLMQDGNDRPLWAPGVTSGAPPTILGYPYTVNNDLDDTADATDVPILFGDFSKYIIRNVRPMTVLRLTERYADYHQVGFFAFERLDGKLTQAAAVAKLTLA